MQISRSPSRCVASPVDSQRRLGYAGAYGQRSRFLSAIFDFSQVRLPSAMPHAIDHVEDHQTWALGRVFLQQAVHVIAARQVYGLVKHVHCSFACSQSGCVVQRSLKSCVPSDSTTSTGRFSTTVATTIEKLLSIIAAAGGIGTVGFLLRPFGKTFCDNWR
jgi:hypothetical protein